MGLRDTKRLVSDSLPAGAFIHVDDSTFFFRHDDMVIYKVQVTKTAFDRLYEAYDAQRKLTTYNQQD